MGISSNDINYMLTTQSSIFQNERKNESIRYTTRPDGDVSMQASLDLLSSLLLRLES